MRQQFFEPLDRMIGDSSENSAEPGKQIDLGQFAGGDKAAQDRCRLTSVIVPKVQLFRPPHLAGYLGLGTLP